MLSKLTKVKLMVFVAITAVALLVTALFYIHLPQQVGIGRYGVDVELANAGGLYPQAMVTYRGVEVGKVTGIDLATGGSVVAHLQVDNGVKLPRDSTAQVRSASVIGEQYVNFLPADKRSDPGAGSGFLEDGDTVPVSRTVLPTSTNTLLSSVDGLLQSVPTKDLRSVVHELGTAFDGVGPDLGRFIDASSTFQKAANANLPATLKLIDDTHPVLRTQESLDPNIRSFARSLDSFSGQLGDSDADLRGVLDSGVPFMDSVATFSDGLTGTLPGVLDDLADTGEVLRVYRPQLEHIAIVLPPTLTMMLAAIPVDRRDDLSPAATMWFKLGVDPAPCTTGFEYADKMRNPADGRPAPAPSTSYCKVPANDSRAPRGARNDPCPNGGTGATAAQCGLVFNRPASAPGATRAASVTRTNGELFGSAGTVFLLQGAPPAPGTWQELLKGLVSP
jgi:phospholipid/cholesterol/gamma-HCH transport system substrate-binding protein